MYTGSHDDRDEGEQKNRTFYSGERRAEPQRLVFTQDQNHDEAESMPSLFGSFAQSTEGSEQRGDGIAATKEAMGETIQDCGLSQWQNRGL